MPYSELGVISYNIGTNIADFEFTCQYNGIKATEDAYEATQEKTAEYFKEMAYRNESDVIFLQEVVDDDRPLVKALCEDKSFKIFHILNREEQGARVFPKRQRYDSAVLLKTDQFKDCVNSSLILEGMDIGLVFATHIKTNQRMVFSSAHISGFSLDEKTIHKDATIQGDHETQGIINVLSQMKGESRTIQVIGADMNANPEKMRSIEENRFKKLEKAGFQTFRTGHATDVFPRSKNYVERELDFIFARELPEEPKKSLLSRLIAKIKLFFCRSKPLFKLKKTEALFNFNLDPDRLPRTSSDHRPIRTTLYIQKK